MKNGKQYIELDGVRLPALAVIEGEHEHWAYVPMENGWVAYILGMPRSGDDVEYCVAYITPEEATEHMSGAALPINRGWSDFPRSGWDLLETLRDASLAPDPATQAEVWR